MVALFISSFQKGVLDAWTMSNLRGSFFFSDKWEINGENNSWQLQNSFEALASETLIKWCET